MLDVALRHAERGFKVFPIRAGEKKPPLIKDWEILATTDVAQIRTWWTQWPLANVGIHCDGMLVIDVDPAKGGWESLAALEQEIELEATYEVETPRGGRHIYYRCATPVRNGVDVLGTGIDVRTTAGYVVGAGSSTASGVYRVVADEPLAEVDAALVARLAARPDKTREVQADVATDADAAVGRARDFLRTHPVAVQGQGGDHHTFRTLCRVRDFGVPRERAAESVAEWNERCVPPWDQAELALKIENAYAYAQDAAGKLTPEALGFERVADAPTSNPQTGGEVPAPPAPDQLIHPADVVAGDVLTAEYLIKHVLERQSNAVIFGHWNVGKTFMVLDMAASIACGQPWFGQRVRQGRVLYLGYEGLRAMKKRIVALRSKYPLLLDRSTPFQYAGLIYPLVRDEGKAELKARLKEFQRKHGGPPDLIIIDPLQNALGGDDSDATLMGDLNREVALIMKGQRCSVLRVHHSGHSNSDRARGHSSLPAGVDTELRASDGDTVSTCVIQEIDNKNPMNMDLTGPQQGLLDALIKLRGDGGHASAADIRHSVSEGTTPAERNKLVAALEKKEFLRVEGNKWVIAERGPLSIFD
jgi:hypothetical protein